MNSSQQGFIPVRPFTQSSGMNSDWNTMNRNQSSSYGRSNYYNEDDVFSRRPAYEPVYSYRNKRDGRDRSDVPTDATAVPPVLRLQKNRYNLYNQKYKMPPNTFMTNEFKKENIQKEELDSTTWVTVSGVTEENLNAVRSFFDSLGTILQSTALIHNYIKIQYSTAYEAERALGYNGKKIDNTYIIGVFKCEEPENQEDCLSFENSALKGDISTQRLDIGENDILRQFPQKRKSFCSTLFDFLLGY